MNKMSIVHFNIRNYTIYFFFVAIMMRNNNFLNIKKTKQDSRNNILQ